MKYNHIAIIMTLEESVKLYASLYYRTYKDL